MPDRKFPRMDIDEPVGVHANDTYRVEKGRQFSEGGMLFESNGDFNEGQHISLTFKLSDTVLIRLDAEIAYVIKESPKVQLIGVRFLEPQTDHIRLLLEYFKKRGTA
jgi:hypothetical protein